MLAAAACGVLVATAGCGGAEQAPQGPRMVAHRCASASGIATDLTRGPDWAVDVPGDGWTDRQGCLVRLDVIGQYRGPGHCGWEAATIISTGLPVGARASDARRSAIFVRDPTNVFGDAANARSFT